jgi:hypothetical protein
VADIVKLFTNGFWRYVIAWLLPCAAFLAGFLLTIYPSIKSLPILASITSATHSNFGLGALIFGGITLGISALLALSYEPIYRVWEGYPWPKRFFIIGRNHELKRYKKLAVRIDTYIDQAEEAEAANDYSSAAFSSNKEALLRELYQLFPVYEVDFLPTRLGNALRAAERYGYERYGLDTQVLWYELGAVAPEPLAEDLYSARGMVDFFVSAATLSWFYAIIAIILAIVKRDLIFLCYALAAVLVSRLSYLRAARGTGAIAKAQQAIVNVSRSKLAELFGLTIPIDIGKEKEMWSALIAFISEGSAEDQRHLQAWQNFAPVTPKGNGDSSGIIGSSISSAGKRRNRGPRALHRRLR